MGSSAESFESRDVESIVRVQVFSDEVSHARRHWDISQLGMIVKRGAHVIPKSSCQQTHCIPASHGIEHLRETLWELWEFDFIYEDVAYGAHNSATDLADAAIQLLAQGCPSLRRAKLPETSGLTHEALKALFENCPNLSEVELQGLRGARGTTQGRSSTGCLRGTT